jgi:hypothetical protein
LFIYSLRKRRGKDKKGKRRRRGKKGKKTKEREEGKKKEIVRKKEKKIACMPRYRLARALRAALSPCYIYVHIYAEVFRALLFAFAETVACVVRMSAFSRHVVWSPAQTPLNGHGFDVRSKLDRLARTVFLCRAYLVDSCL